MILLKWCIEMRILEFEHNESETNTMKLDFCETWLFFMGIYGLIALCSQSITFDTSVAIIGFIIGFILDLARWALQ